VLKIDIPMTRLAVKEGSPVGVIVTFPPTQAITRTLLEDAALEAGQDIEMEFEIEPRAVEAILAGDRDTHDRLLLEAGKRLGRKGVRSVVLAQVSMAHLVEPLRELLGIPVFSSLETSLVAVKQEFGLA
jgi:Asp/Glu/hydantoin racemase